MREFPVNVYGIIETASWTNEVVCGGNSFEFDGDNDGEARAGIAGSNAEVGVPVAAEH